MLFIWIAKLNQLSGAIILNPRVFLIVRYHHYSWFINFPKIAELFRRKQETVIVKKKEITNTYRYLNNIPIIPLHDILQIEIMDTGPGISQVGYII